MPYCLYVRKSRADAELEARGEGETLSRHIGILLALAKRRNLNVTQIYKEIVSGETIAARPVMQQLLSEVEQGLWEGVLVVEIERLARGDTIDQGIVAQTFKFSNTKIITPVKDYNPCNEFDEEYFEFGLFMSRREYKTINRRLQSGRIASVKEGNYIGGAAPFGYEKLKLQDGSYSLTPNESEADTVRLIYSLYTVGMPDESGSFCRLGSTRIAKRLDEMHIPSRSGGKWSPSSVRDILINPVYCGKIRWGWRPYTKKKAVGSIVAERHRNNDCILTEGKHLPLIPKETFNLAQELLQSRTLAPTPGKAVIQNPLCGLIVCAKCGHNLIRLEDKKHNKVFLHCTDIHCDNISSMLSMVEERLLVALQEWVDDYRVKLGLNDKTDSTPHEIAVKQKTLKKTEAEISKLNGQLQTAYDLLEQKIYTTELFLERSAVLSEKIRVNTELMSTLQKDIKLANDRMAARIEIIPKIENLLLVYGSLPSAKEKNDMLKEVIEKAEYIKLSKGIRNKPSDNFSLTLYPRIPKT